MVGIREKLFFLFFGQVLGIFFLEFLNTASRINQFLLPGEKRMACRTDFNMYVLFDGTKFKFAATSAPGNYFIVFRMYSRLHFFKPPNNLSVSRLECLPKHFNIQF